MIAAPDLDGRVTSVLEGRGGRLFLDRAPGFDARTMHGAPFDREGDLEALWGRPLDRLTALADEIGARLVLLIPPDAQGVHAEDLPPQRVYATPSIGDAVAALARARGVPTLTPREALRDARGPVEVFRRTDSHWSGFGAYVAYRELMAALPDCGARVVPSEEVEYEWRWEAGDLGAGLDPPRRAPVAAVQLRRARSHAVFDAVNAERHALKITEHPDRALPTAMMIRDSYASELAPFLAESFRRLALVGAGGLVLEDLIREERPQVIVLERAERCLPFGLQEPDPLSDWREHWPAAGDGPEEADAREFELRAGRAMLCGSGAEAVEACEAAGLAGSTPDRSALLGRALEMAGGDGAADAFLLASLGAPDRFAFAMRLGAARLRQGRDADARDAFARACALRPWSGAAYEHLGYAALRLGDADLARYGFERASAVSPHRPGGWLWLGELQAARCEVEAAARTFGRGLQACPDDAALLAAQARLRGEA